MQVALEQILDRLERGEVRSSSPGVLPVTQTFAKIAEEVRKAFETPPREAQNQELRNWRTSSASGVLGCGLMGSGIAQVAASVGYDTIVRDVSKEVLDRGRAGIEKSLAKFVEKGKLQAADRDATLKRLTFTTTVADLKPADIVIEAITEDLALKKRAVQGAGRALRSRHHLRSNTSSLTIAEMAAATSGRTGLSACTSSTPCR